MWIWFVLMLCFLFEHFHWFSSRLAFLSSSVVLIPNCNAYRSSMRSKISLFLIGKCDLCIHGWRIAYQFWYVQVQLLPLSSQKEKRRNSIKIYVLISCYIRTVLNILMRCFLLSFFSFSLFFFFYVSIPFPCKVVANDSDYEVTSFCALIICNFSYLFTSMCSHQIAPLIDAITTVLFFASLNFFFQRSDKALHSYTHSSSFFLSFFLRISYAKCSSFLSDCTLLLINCTNLTQTQISMQFAQAVNYLHVSVARRNKHHYYFGECQVLACSFSWLQSLLLFPFTWITISP